MVRPCLLTERRRKVCTPFLEFDESGAVTTAPPDRTHQRYQKERCRGVTRLSKCGIPAVLLVFAVLLSGCITHPPGTGPEESGWNSSPVTPTPIQEGTLPISGITWVLVSYDSGRLAKESIVPGSVVTARFEREGVMYGSSGCNRYWARYEASPSKVSIDAPQRTNAVCNTPSGVHSQESMYLLDLGKASTYRVDGDFLSLLDGNGRAVLLFGKETAPEDSAHILQETWYLTALRDDQGFIVNSPEGVLVTARFLDETVSGFAGCNCYVAPAYIRSAAIRIETPLATDTWCRNETVRNQERLYLIRIQEVDAYVPGDNSLILVNGQGETLLVFGTRT